MEITDDQLDEVVARVVADVGACSDEDEDRLVELTADACAWRTIRHPDYALLGGRILVSRAHELITGTFGDVTRTLSVGKEYASSVAENEEILNAAVDYGRDYDYSYFAYKTLAKSYLKKVGDRVAERPQDAIMRIAVAIHGGDVDRVLETYRLASLKYFTHASPVWFNAGSATRQQLASCFLFTLPSDDDEEGIFENVKRCGITSKLCGGVGIGVHSAPTESLTQLLKIYEAVAKFAGQGENKRPGAFAVYLEPWHPSILAFLNLRKNVGPEEERTRDLFLGLWIPDLFMERVRRDESWSLMDPRECPGLAESHGSEFERLYLEYEAEGRYCRRIEARRVWAAAIESQIETGTPYMMYKDACNRKSNQRHSGTIRTGNLCAEIVQYSSPDEVAVCNLASLSLKAFVQTGEGRKRRFDFEGLRNVTRVVVENLNRVIDATDYPVPEARTSNLRHRPVGVGVQGLADAFALLGVPFDGEEARALNRRIFESIYYAALDASCSLAARDGPYETYDGSPASEGKLQFDLWLEDGKEVVVELDWTELRRRIAAHGLRNSLLVAVMPTASTAQILGNVESIEPFVYNVYQRNVTSGTFGVVNEYLARDLAALGLWTEKIRNEIVVRRGSVRDVEEIPDRIKALYKTAWEMSQAALIRLSADRAPFVDQSQSLNLYVADPTYAGITSMHFYAYDLGLKTGMYYLRTQSVVRPLSSVLSNLERCETCTA